MVRAGWEVVVCCASGPSFDEAQAAEVVAARELDACRVIAVNDNYRRVPNADVVYAADYRWWRVNSEKIDAAGFAGERWSVSGPAVSKFGVRGVAHRLKPGLTQSDGLLHGGGNSGYQAINLAYLFGARRVVLVGFDMQATGGALHWFGRHPHPDLDRGLPFASWIDRFRDLARDCAIAGLEVVNASRETALTCFPRAPLSDALATRP